MSSGTLIEAKQHSRRREHSVAHVLLPLVLFIVLAVALSLFNALDGSLSGEAVLPQNIAYISGDTLEDVQVIPSMMTPVTHYSQVRSPGKYTHIAFTVPASTEARKLYIYTPFSQIDLDIEENRLVQQIQVTGVFTQRARHFVVLAPTSEDVHVSLIIKNSFASTYKAYLLPERYSIFALFSDTVAWVFWPVSLLTFLVVTILRLKKSKAVLNKVDLTAFLLCLGTTVNVYAQYLQDGQRLASKIGFLLVSVAGLFFIAFLLEKLRAQESFRQTLVGLGFVLCAVIMPGTSAEITVLAMRALGLYFVFCLLAILVSSFNNRGNHAAYGLPELYYLLFFVGFVSQFLFFALDVTIDYLNLQILFPLVAGISAYVGYSVEMKDPSPCTLADRTHLMDFKPFELGRLQDLFEIFLEEQEYREHSRNVSLYVYEICKAADMDQEHARIIAQVAFLHDIGKMMLPKSLLLKPQNLTREEYEQIKLHTKYGADLLSNSSIDMLKMAGIVALQHHERYDGNGYFGLKENEINPYAQIVSIADVFDAATTQRAYKKPWTFDEGFDYIQTHSGTLFNPVYAKAFVNAREDIYRIFCSTR